MSDNSVLEGAVTAVSRRKLADEVLDRLLQFLESGSLQPGDQLPSERELMATYQVGRPAVREALQSLQQMGRISINHGERARVVSLTPNTMFEQIGRSARHLLSTSPQTLEDLKEARLMFEVGMVRIAAQKATRKDLDHLHATLEALASSRKRGRAFLEADLAFHKTIASVPGNPIFVAVSSAMLGWLADFHTELVRAYGAEDVTLSEHGAIYERIAAHDPDGAAKAMADHLTRASALYRNRRKTVSRNAAN